MRISLEGDFDQEEILQALRDFFPKRRIIIADNESKHSSEPGAIILFKDVNDKERKLQNIIKEQTAEINELRVTSKKAQLNIQTFQKQQKTLFDEFVQLRTRYGEQKTLIVNILWMHCAPHHPELKHIPAQEEERFQESESQVGSYVIEDMLGEGQFASVSSCYRLGEADMKYAIKMIKKERVTTYPSLMRISQEIEILSRLKSPYIISIEDKIHTSKMLYLILQKGGPDLFEFFDQHPHGVPLPWAKQIMAAIITAVHFCHENSVCHRGTFFNSSFFQANTHHYYFGVLTRFETGEYIIRFRYRKRIM